MNRIDGLVVFLSITFSVSAIAAKVVLKVQVTNPSETIKKVDVVRDLPSYVTTNDVLDTGGLEIRYDVKRDIYFLYGAFELKPKETRIFDIVIRDVWNISEEKIKRYRDHVNKLTEMLSTTRHAKLSSETACIILEILEKVKDSQNNSQIGTVSVLEHIKTFELNCERMKDAERMIGRLENVLLGEGKSPPELLGLPDGVPRPSRSFPIKPSENILLYQIEIDNPLTNSSQVIELKRTLPPEVQIEDIVDSGGFDVFWDEGIKACVLYKKNLEIPPGKTIFTVKLRDKWNIHFSRIQMLIESCSNLFESVSKIEAYAPVTNMLQQIINELNAISKRKAPGKLDASYVAFYRNQGKEIDLLEEKLNRIRSALREQKRVMLGFETPKPSKRTAWLLIYFTLGFLLFLSIAFFLRWYPVGKDMDNLK